MMTMAKAKTKSVRLITKDFSRAIFFPLFFVCLFFSLVAFFFFLVFFFHSIRRRNRQYILFVNHLIPSHYTARIVPSNQSMCSRKIHIHRNGVGFVYSHAIE